MLSSVLTVTQVNTFIKSLLEGDGRLDDFFVQGELSNFNRHYKSGHMYFSLKDDKSVLKAVMFASSAVRMKFVPQDGMRVIVRGRISVYEPSGQYQMYATDMQPDGIGALSLAFEQLKAKLEAEGLFAQESKKALPLYPENIAVITSKNGAALRDILHITARRWPIASILLHSVSVQGEAAAGEITAEIKGVNKRKEADLIIIGRGGGSYEDLQAFNDENLARAIFASEIPVVSAVGHETDFTIADFVADVRASTPSAAAEISTPDMAEELSKLVSYVEYFKLKSRAYLETQKQKTDLLVAGSPLASPLAVIAVQSEKLHELGMKMKEAGLNFVSSEETKLTARIEVLNSLSPLSVLMRGYSYVTHENGRIISKASDVRPGDKINIRLSDGMIKAEVTETEDYHE